MLAGLISNPSGYDPRAHPELAMARRNLVLHNMIDQGYITQEEYDQYSKQPLPDPSQIHPPVEDSKAPYFTSWLRQQLVDKYGAGEAFGGGLDVQSTLDLPLQDAVQQAADSRTLGVGLNSAVVVLDNATGGVRAMVGGSDFQTQPFNLATQGHRQPGSAFKPFTLVTALEQGHSPDQVFTSAPQRIPYQAKISSKGGGEKTVPEIFDVSNYGDEYEGSASITTATTYSDNSIYSQLGTQAGPANVAQTAYKMGIQTDLSDPNVQYSISGHPFAPYNPALILGGLRTGVSALEMAHAYLTLQHSGQLVSGTMADHPGDPVGIAKVADAPPGEGGDLIEPNGGGAGYDQIETKQVIDPGVAATARGILHTVVTSGTGTNAYTGDPTEWGKTGTTENNGDAWFVGATKDITVAVWVGHADTVKPMTTEYGGAPVDGGTIPALIFNDVVTAYTRVQAEHRAAEHSNSPDTGTTTTTPTAPTATTPTTPAPAPTDTQPAPSQSPAPSSGTGGGSTGGAAAPSTGGASPSG